MGKALGGQVVHANSTMSLEREAALISEAALDTQKPPVGALDFDLQVQDMSKVMVPPPTASCAGFSSCPSRTVCQSGCGHVPRYSWATA